MNFRSIEDITLSLPQVCALVGPNNSGNSNILEAVRRVLGTGWVSVSSFAAEDVFMHDSARDITISCSIDPPIQFQRFKGAPPTAIHALSFEYTRYKMTHTKSECRAC
jgi:putative ATP-dependent endonuclease of the OLD family